VSEERLDAVAFRAELLELVSRAVPMYDPGEDELDEPHEGVPTAVLVVVEWQGDDGKRWLSTTSALGSGQVAPSWTARMLAREALDWPSEGRET
jgi:hypothetical protein